MADPAALAAALSAMPPGGLSPDAGTALLGALAQTIAQQAAQATTMQQQLAALHDKVTETKNKTGNRNMLVDTKTLGRVEKFRGARKDWSDWSFSFRAFLGGVHEHAVHALGWASSQSETITDKTIGEEAEGELLKDLNGQVYTALSLLVQGDALDKLRQCPDGAGLEAWRRIVAFYEPMNRGHKLRVLHRIMNPVAAAGQTPLKAIEQWEEIVKKYEDRFQTKVDIDTQMGALCQLFPPNLREHVYMNADRYKTYEEMRSAAALYLEEKQELEG